MLKIKQYYAKMKAKGELMKCFKEAELFKRVKRGDKTFNQYPHIHDVNYDEGKEKLTYTFTIPNGMNPDDIYSKEYAFIQRLGENIVIKGKHKKFTLTMYFKELPKKIPYNYQELINHVKGMNLPVVCGINLEHEHVIYDMAKYETLMLSGEIGAGKSSLIRCILTFLIQYKKPSDIEFYLFDLKRSELGIYRHVEHVKGVYVDIDKIKPVMRTLKKERERRGDLLDQEGVQHIDDLPNKLSRIVICIDEVSLLRKEKKIMEEIENIAATGRALGMHLIMAQQRPDSKIYESGAMKNNMRVRISGRQSNAINAKVAGVEGAETIKMEQRGRMKMFMDDVIEFQGFLLEGEDAKKILQAYKTPPVPTKNAPEEEPKANEFSLDEVFDDE
jgi:DNA segregation ATPase FtsK/SpoIIIE, S-DNA-T family